MMINLRSISALCRPARLPTVWSNCLAGWWLGGGGNGDLLPFLFAGATLLYLGGAFLNDAFDADFDRAHQPWRPVASGAISQQTVFRWGITWLVAGALVLQFPGRGTGSAGLLLVLCLVIYNTTHRLVPGSPVLEGVCRFFLYVLGASVGEHGITGWPLWCGLALAAYVTGLRYLARSQEAPGPARLWPVALLSLPIVLALLMNVGRYREPALLLSIVLLLWCARSLRQTFWAEHHDLRQTVEGLVAGIVFVDWLSTCPVASVGGQTAYAPREISVAFIALFLVTLGIQRVSPERPLETRTSP